MAQPKEKELPLLMDQLSVPEKVMLGQQMHGPGFKVIVKLLDEMCRRFDEAVKLLDPEQPDYAHCVAVRLPRSRNAAEFRNLLLNSIKYHVESAHVQAVQEDAEAVDAVSKVYGIHIVDVEARKKKNAVEKVQDAGQ